MAASHFEVFVEAFSALDLRARELDGDQVLCPPVTDLGYESTPNNALTFANTGVDGGHMAILKIDGQLQNNSPVVQVDPMDSMDVSVLAGSFLNYLSVGCGITEEQMEGVFETARKGRGGLVGFLTNHFKKTRLLSEERIALLNSEFEHLIERRSERTE